MIPAFHRKIFLLKYLGPIRGYLDMTFEYKI